MCYLLSEWRLNHLVIIFESIFTDKGKALGLEYVNLVLRY